MNCARCGTANDPGMYFCVNCGNALQEQPPPPPSFNQPAPSSWQAPTPYGQQPFGQTPTGYGQPPPPLGQPNLFGAYAQDIPSYLTQAILCTLFCCVPPGIVAIVYA